MALVVTLLLGLVFLLGCALVVGHLHRVRRGHPPLLQGDVGFYVKAYAVIWLVAFGLSYAAPGVIATGCARTCTLRGGGSTLATGRGTVALPGHLLAACAVVGLVVLLQLGWAGWTRLRPGRPGPTQFPEE